MTPDPLAAVRERHGACKDCAFGFTCDLGHVLAALDAERRTAAWQIQGAKDAAEMLVVHEREVARKALERAERAEAANARVEELLRLFAWDDTDWLWWRGSESATEGEIEFYVKCNDTFYYACADCERIVLPDDLEGLRKAKEELPDGFWPLLWAARKRGRRPLAGSPEHKEVLAVLDKEKE